MKAQIDYLVVVGEGRKGGDDDEHMAVFIKREKFRLRELSSFQLSETPEIIISGPEVNPRMVTWVRLAVINRPESGKEGPYPPGYRGHWKDNRDFYVFNTHYFNRRDQAMARLNASRLILERIQALERFGEWKPERPVFLMGDLIGEARPKELGPAAPGAVGWEIHPGRAVDDAGRGSPGARRDGVLGK